MSLDLTNNLINGEGGFAISLVLKENTRLKVLKLGMNKIDDLNASKILFSLGKNDYLEELDMASNNLGDMVIMITKNLIHSALLLYLIV